MDRHLALARRIGRELRRKGMTAHQAAAAAGLSPTTLTRITQGESVKPASYSKLERVLGWPTDTCQDWIEGRGELPPDDRGDVARAGAVRLADGRYRLPPRDVDEKGYRRWLAFLRELDDASPDEARGSRSAG